MFSFGGLDEALKLLRVCWSVSALKILDCEANLLFPVLPPAVCRQSRTLFFFFFLWLFLLFGLSACSWRTNRTTAGIILRQQRAALPATAIKVACRTKTVNKTTSCYEVKRTNSNSWQSRLLPRHGAWFGKWMWSFLDLEKFWLQKNNVWKDVKKCNETHYHSFTQTGVSARLAC